MPTSSKGKINLGQNNQHSIDNEKVNLQAVL